MTNDAVIAIIKWIGSAIVIGIFLLIAQAVFWAGGINNAVRNEIPERFDRIEVRIDRLDDRIAELSANVRFLTLVLCAETPNICKEFTDANIVIDNDSHVFLYETLVAPVHAD